ncbi:hypothetical protein ACIRQH_11370 [Streptomyces sp. NPDC102279]|uniref:hypothetical protein n=1 Tax=Streptomyces sp. NPDC102279 TaxID=3366153 RepID=UPI0037FCEF0D
MRIEGARAFVETRAGIEVRTEIYGAIPPEELVPFRAPYAILAWHLARRGYDVSADLLGDDQPERTAAFYAEDLTWLGS